MHRLLPTAVTQEGGSAVVQWDHPQEEILHASFVLGKIRGRILFKKTALYRLHQTGIQICTECQSILCSLHQLPAKSTGQDGVCWPINFPLFQPLLSAFHSLINGGSCLESSLNQGFQRTELLCSSNSFIKRFGCKASIHVSVPKLSFISL